ncbi:MAG: hypothetical protein H0U55_04350, partial [Rubrobacteraceae bacterium]|nr:hypothetical protein [Rubrobacteraceae bacterium]
AQRDTNAAQHVLVGSSSAYPGSVILLIETTGANGTFNMYNGVGGAVWTVSTGSAAWPALGVPVVWALEFNETTDAAKLYLNGALAATGTHTAAYAAAAGNHQIGAYGANQAPFDGKQAHVAVFSSALTAADHAYLYALTLAQTNERITFGTLALNDQTTWFAESLTVAPPSKRLQRLASPDADSDILAELVRHDLRTVTMRLRYVGTSAQLDTALDAINDLSGRLQQAEEIDAGVALTWKPASSGHTGTMYVQSGEITDLPVTQEGDDAGWFLANPVITVRFDCFPFIYGAEYLAGSTASTASRILTLTAANVPGTVPGLGRLVITDTASQNRSHIEIGGDRYGYNASASMDILGSSMTSLGGTLTGSGAGSYQSMTVGTAPVAICEAASLPHLGPHNVRAQVEWFSGGTSVQVRAASRTVDGPWRYSPWRDVPVNVYGPYDANLGPADFQTVKRGAQVSTIRIEAKGTGGPLLRVYRINPIPTEVVYGLARGFTSTAPPTSFSVYDTFLQTAGNLDTPKVAPTGGNWAEANRVGANGFQVETTGKTAQRTTVSDAAITSGSFAYVGSSIAGTAMQATVKFGVLGVVGYLGQFGILARYVDASNWLMLALQPNGNVLAASYLTVIKQTTAAGAVNLMSQQSPEFGYPGTKHELKLEVDATGYWRAYWQPDPSGIPILIMDGYHADLVTGGTLASGKVGLYDAWASATALTRNYDDVQASTPVVDYPLYSGRSVMFAHDYAQREVAAGTNYSDVPSYRGRRLYIPPAGPGNLTTRLVVKDRRNDVDGGLPDSADSSRSAALYVVPRYLVAP